MINTSYSTPNFANTQTKSIEKNEVKQEQNLQKTHPLYQYGGEDFLKLSTEEKYKKLFGVGIDDYSADDIRISETLSKMQELLAGLDDEYLHKLGNTPKENLSPQEQFDSFVNFQYNLLVRDTRNGKFTFLAMMHNKMQNHEELTELFDIIATETNDINLWFIGANATLDDMSFDEFRDLVYKVRNENLAQKTTQEMSFENLKNSQKPQNTQKRKAIKGFSENIQANESNKFREYLKFMQQVGIKNIQTKTLLDVLLEQKEFLV